MGSATTYFADIDATITWDWLPNNRLRNIVWQLNSPGTGVRFIIIRGDIEPPQVVYDQIHIGISSGSETIPGNWQLELVSDPEYPEELPRLILPEGISFHIEKVNI